jgi:hypothetical protein
MAATQMSMAYKSAWNVYWLRSTETMNNFNRFNNLSKNDRNRSWNKFLNLIELNRKGCAFP